jgi:two-component system, chemotaxis family, chemotaxis protein CheY
VTRPNRPVLVVEDHKDTREMVEHFLRLDGYLVCGAANGVEALECVARDTPCLILLDVSMPVMDGLTFARRLHQHSDPEIAATPIVLLTAIPNAVQVQREVGALAVIQKPVSFDTVAAMVARHCSATANDGH